MQVERLAEVGKGERKNMLLSALGVTKIDLIAGQVEGRAIG
jgi:hypothetical protein